eukprot:CAMPEP_0173256286 /NCGR_PEP_ID=MMETSP1142-20121109/23062_1 /TAXON_ID=483371 /ORGANISM="non described non described, Strain CCMP2298" /LENGTH=81 /DNA_ID=CAMNT_0014190151 /DNA_START=9 /DNA_END=250 /DNA_ORIENTATION=+
MRVRALAHFLRLTRPLGFDRYSAAHSATTTEGVAAAARMVAVVSRVEVGDRGEEKVLTDDVKSGEPSIKPEKRKYVFKNRP